LPNSYIFTGFFPGLSSVCIVYSCRIDYFGC
jgi:hypothetical protein